MTPDIRDIITTFAADGRTPQQTAQALSLYREDVYDSIKEEAGPNVRDVWIATEGLNADIQEGLDTLRDSSIRSFVDEKIPDPTVQNEFWTQIKNEQPIDGRFGVTEQDLIGITNEPTFRVQADSSTPINVDAGQRRLFSYLIRPRQNETFEALVLSPENGDMLLSFPEPKPEQIDEMAVKLEETRKQNAREVLGVDIRAGADYTDLGDEDVETFALQEGPSNLSAKDTAARRDAQHQLRLTMAKLAALRGPQGKDFARNELLVERMKQDDMIDFVGGRGVGNYAQDLAVGLSMFGLATVQSAAMATGNQEKAEGLARLNKDIQETTGSYGVQFSGGMLQRATRGAGQSVGVMAPALALGPAGRMAGLVAGTAETVALSFLAPATYSLAYNETIEQAKALEQQGRIEEAQVLRNRAGIKAVADTVFELGVERINPFFSQVGAAGWARRLPKQVFQEAIVEEPLTMLLQQEVSNRVVDRPSSYEQLPEVVLSAAIATTGTQTATGVVQMMLPKAQQPNNVTRNVAAAASGQPVQVNPQAIRPQNTPAVAVAAQTNPETLAAVVAMTTNTTPQNEDGPEWISERALERVAQARLAGLERKGQDEDTTLRDAEGNVVEEGAIRKGFLTENEQAELNRLREMLSSEGMNLAGIASMYGRKIKSKREVQKDQQPAPVAAPQSATELQRRWQALEDRALAATEAGATDRLPAIRDEQREIAIQINNLRQQPPIASNNTPAAAPQSAPVAPVKSNAQLLGESKSSLDDRAKALGFAGIRQMNTRLLLSNDLSGEQRQLIDEYGKLNQGLRSLEEQDASQLSDENFEVWSKPLFAPAVTNEGHLADMAKLHKALTRRGKIDNANRVLDILKGTWGRKTDWTPESWSQRFDGEQKTNQEIEGINSDSQSFNESLTAVLDSIDAGSRQTAPVAPATPAPAATPPVTPPEIVAGVEEFTDAEAMAIDAELGIAPISPQSSEQSGLSAGAATTPAQPGAIESPTAPITGDQAQTQQSGELDTLIEEYSEKEKTISERIKSLRAKEVEFGQRGETGAANETREERLRLEQESLQVGTIRMRLYALRVGPALQARQQAGEELNQNERADLELYESLISQQSPVASTAQTTTQTQEGVLTPAPSPAVPTQAAASLEQQVAAVEDQGAVKPPKVGNTAASAVNQANIVKPNQDEVAAIVPELFDNSFSDGYNQKTPELIEGQNKITRQIEKLLGLPENYLTPVRWSNSKVWRTADGDFIKIAASPTVERMQDLQRQIDFLRGSSFAMVPEMIVLHDAGIFMLRQQSAGIEGNDVYRTSGFTKGDQALFLQLQEQNPLSADTANDALRVETDGSLKNMGLYVENGMVKTRAFDFDGVTEEAFQKDGASASQILAAAPPMLGVPLSEFSPAVQQVLKAQSKAAVETPVALDTQGDGIVRDEVTVAKGDLATVSFGGREYPKTRIINVVETPEGTRYQVDLFGPKFLTRDAIVTTQQEPRKAATAPKATPQLVRQLGDIAVGNKEPISQSYVDAIGGRIPSDYVKEGDGYTYSKKSSDPALTARDEVTVGGGAAVNIPRDSADIRVNSPKDEQRGKVIFQRPDGRRYSLLDNSKTPEEWQNATGRTATLKGFGSGRSGSEFSLNPIEGTGLTIADAAPNTPVGDSLYFVSEPSSGRGVGVMSATELFQQGWVLSPLPAQQQPATPATLEGQTQAETPQREGQGQEVADLTAVRDNTATPEQVQRLQGQGLVEQVAGQTVITQAGIQAMPETERPRLTEQERRAEIQQQAQPIPGAASTELEREAIISSPQYTQEWLQDETAKAQEEGVQDGDTVITRDESGETIVGTVAATTGETTTISTTSGDVTVPTAGLVRQSPQSLSRKPGLAQALMESDGAALQLGISARDVEKGIAATKRQIPGAQNIWSGTRQEFLDTFGNEPSLQKIIGELEGGVMTEGFYDETLMRGFILLDGAVVYEGDAARAALNGTAPAVETVKRLIRHEVGGHGGWTMLTQKQQDDFLEIARDVIPVSDVNQMIEDGYPFRDWQTDEDVFYQAATEWAAQRFGRMDKLPETGPMARFVEWLKDVWHWLTGRKTEPDIQALKDLWRQIRMNEAAIATGRSWYSLPRDGARAQAVTAQDAEYLATASKGDSGSDNLIQLLRDAPESERRAVVDAWVQRNPKAAAEMQRMVDEAAKAAGYNIEGYHNTNSDFTIFRPSTSGKLGEGIYWSQTPRAKFGKRQIRAYIKSDNPMTVANAPEGALKRVGKLVMGVEIGAAKNAGFDGVQLTSTENTVFDPNQIKSADPVTYDSNGAPIPPSQRFQSTSPDIRYSRVRSNAELLARTKEVSFIPMDPETASEQIDVRDSLYAAFRGDPDIDKITAEAIKYHPMKSRHVAEAALSMWLELTAEARDPSVRAEMTPAEAVANANTPEEVALAEADHREAVAQAITLSQPVSAEAVARYGIPVPPDYALMGALYARFMPNIERATEMILNPIEAESGGFAHDTPQGVAVLVQANIAINQYAQRATPYERNKLKNYQIKIDKVVRSLSTEGGRFLVMVGIFKRALQTSGSNVVAALQDMLDKKQQAKIDSVMNVDDVVGEIETLSRESDPQVASELNDEIAALWDRMMRTDDIREAEAIADVLKSLMPRRQNAKRQIASLFPQAGIRARMTQRGTQLVRDFFKMLAGSRDQSGPLAEFDDSIQSALSEMLRKVVKDAGLLSQNESNQPDAVDRIVRSLSSDPLRFDKIEAADALMQQELDGIEDVERREVLRQAWEEATAGMMTNIANPSWTRRAVNDALNGAKVTGKQWGAAFDTGAPRAQAVAAIKQRAIDDTIRAIESRLTDPGDTTVQRNLGIVRSEIGEAFDQITEVKYATWLRNRSRIAEQKRLSAMRKSIVAALRKQKMSQDTIDRLEKAMAATKGGFLQWSQGTATPTKRDPKATNPLRDLIDAHSRLDVPDFIEQAVAAGLATDDATKLRDAITRYRNSRYLDPDSPLLSTLFNQIKNRVAGDIAWADLISVDQMDGKKRQAEIYKRITNHAALRGMDRAQKIALTKALNRLWVKKKQEVMKRELAKLGLTKSGRDPRVASLFESTANRSIDLTEFRERARAVVPVAGWRKFNKQITNTFREIRSGAMNPEKFDELIGQPRKMMDVDVRRIIDSTPEILRYMNLGMWNAQALRDAISEKYGVKSLDSKEAKEIEDLARQAYNAEPGLPRNKLLVEIMRKMANLEDVSMLQLVQSYRVANLLLSWRTWVAAGLTILNSARRLLGLIAYQSISSTMGGTPQRMKASLESSKKFFTAMPEAVVISLAYLSSGDISLLPSITNDLESMFASGKFGFSVSKMAQAEELIKNLKGLPGRIKRDVKNGDARKMIRDVLSSFFALPIMASQRIMGAIDLYVGITSREAVIPLVAALNPDLFDLKKVLAEQRPEAFKKAYAQAEQELFGRPAKGIRERAEASIRAREFMARIFDPYLAEESMDFSLETTYQMNPTGIGGYMYKAVTAGFRMVEAGADQLKIDLDNKVERGELGAIEKNATQLGVAAIRFLASTIQTDLGFRFIRFTGNRVNELISLTPVLGLARMFETSIQQSKIKQATLVADQAFGMAFTLFAASLIMAEWDEDIDDEERGWYIEGPWSGLTADQKDAGYASGKKPYTFAVRVMGKWQVFNYREWQTAGLFATLGAMMDRKRYQREAWDKQGATGAIVSSAALGLMSFKDMSSLSQLMTLAGNNPYERDPVQGSQDAFGKFAGSFLSSMVPTFTRDIDYMMNPEHRKAEFWHEQAVMRIPVARLSVGQPMLDIFFEPVLVDRGPLSRVVYERTEEPARVALGKLNSADINVSAPELENRIVGRGMDARPMTESEKNRFKQRWNRDFKRYLVTNTDRLLRMKRDEAQEKVRDDLSEIKQNIEDEVAP